MNFATKAGVVANMSQETEKINDPVRMFVLIESVCYFTYLSRPLTSALHFVSYNLWYQDQMNFMT